MLLSPPDMRNAWFLTCFSEADSRLLPGPPLRHEHRTSPGFSTSQLPPEPDLGGPGAAPGVQPQTMAKQMMSWLGGAPAPPSTLTPGGFTSPEPPGQLSGAPKGSIKSNCRSMKNQRHCPPSTLGPLGPVCGWVLAIVTAWPSSLQALWIQLLAKNSQFHWISQRLKSTQLSRVTPINLRVQPSVLLMLPLGDGSKVDTSRAWETMSRGTNK